ncbi:FYVE, RhoGEF and PH domain-containing protein 5-like [Mustelus asterias]
METGDGAREAADIAGEEEIDGLIETGNGAGGEADGAEEEAGSVGGAAEGAGEEPDGLMETGAVAGEVADVVGEAEDGTGEETDGAREEETDGLIEMGDGAGGEPGGLMETADGAGGKSVSAMERADGTWQEPDRHWDEVDGPREMADEPGDEGNMDKSDRAKGEADEDGAGSDRGCVEAEGTAKEQGEARTDGTMADEDMICGEEADMVDCLVGTKLTGSSKVLILKGNHCEEKEEFGQDDGATGLSLVSVTVEEEEFSARGDHLDICNDNITEQVRRTISNCTLPVSGGAVCRLLLEQNTGHTEKTERLPSVSLASADLRRVSALFGKVEADKAGTVDWNNMRMRTRSLSSKVPATVPEECVPESPLPKLCGRTTGDHKPVKMDGEACEKTRVIPANHRRHTFYPRSYSVESCELPISDYRETEAPLLDDSRLTRKEDNLPLPSVVLKQNPLAMSDNSTPSAVMEIPPPFQLASITKKPITKSSPSLLVESESPDKYLKQSAKKKSSFKRFLPIKLSLKKKIENKITVEVNVCKTPSDTTRGLDFDGRSLGNSPQIKARSGKMCILDSSSTFLINKDGKRKGKSKAFSRSVSRVESFEDRSRHSYTSLPLTKPRSISFPNTDTSDYENIPAVSSDYENIQIPARWNGHSGTVAEFFDDPRRAFTSASENDGYVDMSNFAPLESRQSTEQELESVDSESLTVCSPSGEEVVSDEDVGNSSESEDIDKGLAQQGDIGLEAYHIAKVMTSSERAYVSVLRFLHTDFREAAVYAIGGETCPVSEQEGVTHILCDISQLYELHQQILRDLEQSIAQWEQTGPRLASVILAQGPRLSMYTRYIQQFESNLVVLDQSSSKSPELPTTLLDFEVYPGSNKLSVKQCLFKLLQRVPQYHLYLTDYLNTLCPHSVEYEDTKAGLLVVVEICELLRQCVSQWESLQKLLEVEHRVRGLHQVTQPGRVLIKEGALLRVTEETWQPRYCFLTNDMFLYTAPQQCGKYQLNKTLPLMGMKVSSVSVEETEKLLRIQSVRGSITFCASSSAECGEWLAVISKAVENYQKMQTLLALRGNAELSHMKTESGLGAKPPILIPNSRMTMCMICASDFTLTWRRQYCNACGKVVCRACSRNKYPLRYLKGRMVRVCDQCYTELKRKELMTVNERSASLLTHSAGSALSFVLQSLHTPFIQKQKKIPAALREVAASAGGVSICGYLLRCKRNKRHWKKLWFVIHEKVLYTYGARSNKVAAESLPLLGFTVEGSKGDEPAAPGVLFQLYHKNILYYSFKAEDSHTAQRWIGAMFEASIL